MYAIRSYYAVHEIDKDKPFPKLPQGCMIIDGIFGSGLNRPVEGFWAEIRIKASKNDIKSIVASGEDLIFTFSKDAEPPTKSFFSKISGKIRISGMRTVYLRLSKNYFEPRTRNNFV